MLHEHVMIMSRLADLMSQAGLFLDMQVNEAQRRKQREQRAAAARAKPSDRSTKVGGCSNSSLSLWHGSVSALYYTH